MKDMKEAVKWYSRAALEYQYALAQKNLGRCYEEGSGVVKDEREAFRWYRLAAEQGNAEAQVDLGNCYLDGIGASKDSKEAVYWYRKAAEAGDAIGQNNLGHCYQFGEGVTQNEEEAAYWYRKSMEQDYAPAKTHLSDLLREKPSSVQNPNRFFPPDKSSFKGAKAPLLPKQPDDPGCCRCIIQ